MSLLLAELPVQLADPEERLVAVRSELTRLKAEHEAEAGARGHWTSPPTNRSPPAAVPVRLAAHLPQRSVVTVTTNVPGPREPLYALGRRLRGDRPLRAHRLHAAVRASRSSATAAR